MLRFSRNSNLRNDSLKNPPNERQVVRLAKKFVDAQDKHNQKREKREAVQQEVWVSERVKVMTTPSDDSALFGGINLLPSSLSSFCQQ